METHHKFPKEQHGFRKKHSTSTLLNTLINDLTKYKEKGKTIGLISLDLSCAFNLLDKTVLLKKLQHIGIQKETILWLESYLSDRTQQVRIDNTLSSKNI